METTVDKPTVVICAWCQKQFPSVNTAVQQLGKEYNFSHGICKRHKAEVLGKPDPKVPDPLDLQQHPDLIQAYSQGHFLPQEQLKERLQKLANIKI